MRSFRPALLLFLLAGSLFASENLALRQDSIDLPGAPATILPADVNGDEIGDLVVVVAYTEWSQIVTEESVEMDQVEGLVEMMTIVPALADRRELHLFLGRPDGGFTAFGTPLELDLSILNVSSGPRGAPVVALTDDGLARLAIVEAEDGRSRLAFEALFERPSVLSHSGALLADLDLFWDLDGDRQLDLLFPSRRGFDIMVGDFDDAKPSSHVPLPDPGEPIRQRRHYPLPTVEDVDGDGRPDLLLRDADSSWDRFWVSRNEGEGRFEAPREIEVEIEAPEDEARQEVVYFGDLDGDGRAEYILEEDLEDRDAGWRKEIKQAKVPSFIYRIHAADEELALSDEPRQEFRTTGYAFEGSDELPMPFGLRDLDGDGRKDLVSVTLDFSLFQAVRILATKTISIGLDFHVWCQQPDGGFRPVSGLDLSGKFKLRLDDLEIGQLSQFAGDFDGDGRFDFLQMGRGKKVSVHLGRTGCAYPADPDLEIRLREEPRNLALVQVGDFDGDGRSDLVIVQPQAAGGKAESAPVRLDLYLSRNEP